MVLNAKITEQELFRQGWRFVCNFGFDSKIFANDDRYLWWDFKEERIWAAWPPPEKKEKGKEVKNADVDMQKDGKGLLGG